MISLVSACVRQLNLIGTFEVKRNLGTWCYAQGHCAKGAQLQLNPSSKRALLNANTESESIACCRYSIFYGTSKYLFISCALNIEITLIVLNHYVPRSLIMGTAKMGQIIVLG